LVYHEDEGGFITFVRRRGNDWQTGMLNLPGGHIEIGEEPHMAAVREFKEEVGSHCSVELVGKIEGFDFQIWIYKTTSMSARLEAGSESVEIHKWSYIQLHPTLVGNLRLVIPLIRSRTRNWVMKDVIPEETRDNNLDFHYKLQFKRTEQEMILSV
jgi:8-oxo-dGTP pyrophosphatase MutT (NUDIX family)